MLFESEFVRNQKYCSEIPFDLTLTTLPGCTMAVSINQGRPRQTRMSNTLLPMALDTAMSPWPKMDGHEKLNDDVDMLTVKIIC